MDDSHLARPHEPNRQATEGDPLWTAAATIEVHAHIAAAVYLMRRAQVTELVVITSDTSRRPVAVITDTDIAQAVADGRDINETHIDELVAEGRPRVGA